MYTPAQQEILDEYRANLYAICHRNDRTPLPFKANLEKHSIQEIISAVSIASGISATAIKGASRSGAIILARFTVASLARELTDASETVIGSHLGGRDHSTISHMVAKAAERRDLPGEALDDYRVIYARAKAML